MCVCVCVCVQVCVCAGVYGKGREGERGERENWSGHSMIRAVAFYNFALVKSRSETQVPVHSYMFINVNIGIHAYLIYNYITK